MNAKTTAQIAVIITVLTVAGVIYSNNTSQVDTPETASYSNVPQIEKATLLSMENIIGKLPSISLNDLDAVTAGSCGIELPYKIPETLR